ncbi:MAG: GntR family transcriptional regulator [Coriobacteriia bacterium]|nr:GntR family transcriptional regulator [Coriobacteriia bacterium]
MVITVQLESTTPLYQQLQTQIIAGIARGDLIPGEQLPSVRVLADQLGINLHTVNKAYSMLQSEGYVVIRGRAGVRVADPRGAGDAARQRKAREVITQYLSRCAQEASIWGIGREEFLRQATQTYDHFAAPERKESSEDKSDKEDKGVTR